MISRRFAHFHVTKFVPIGNKELKDLKMKSYKKWEYISDDTNHKLSRKVVVIDPLA